MSLVKTKNTNTPPVKRTIYSNIIRYVYAGDRHKVGKALDKLRQRTINATFVQLLRREMMMKCLWCSTDLRKEILGHHIRFHFCKPCRQKIIEHEVTRIDLIPLKEKKTLKELFEKSRRKNK